MSHKDGATAAVRQTGGNTRPGRRSLGIVLMTALVVSILLFRFGDVAFVFVLDKPDEARWEKARADMTEIATALNLHATRHNGDYPASLGDVAHLFGGNLPTDPFTRGQYQYKRTPEGFLLFSPGSDRVAGGNAPPEKDITFNKFGPMD